MEIPCLLNTPVAFSDKLSTYGIIKTFRFLCVVTAVALLLVLLVVHLLFDLFLNVQSG